MSKSRDLANLGSNTSLLATDVEVDAITSLLATSVGVTAALLPKANLASPTFTGTTNVASPTAAGSNGVRQITTSTVDPSGGSDGDVWIKYV